MRYNKEFNQKLAETTKLSMAIHSGRGRQVPENAIIEKSKKIYDCAEKQKAIANEFKHIVYEEHN